MKALRTPCQVDGSQRVGCGHIWPCPLDSPNGKLGLAKVILTGCQGIGEGLSDDILKVRVHVGMRARPGANEKPHRSEAGFKRQCLLRPHPLVLIPLDSLYPLVPQKLESINRVRRVPRLKHRSKFSAIASRPRALT